MHSVQGYIYCVPWPCKEYNAIRIVIIRVGYKRNTVDDVISFENVFKRIGQREIMKNITLTVKPGDIFGFLRPNGAGKGE